jgi:NAD(P)-dependent dehydrogenase (short-subunit alcohol dehydrogenase family)
MAQEVLAGRHALVTGGARGLGAAMAQALAAAGAAVMIGDVLEDLAGETAKACGGHATPLDVTDEASWEQAVAATVEQLGGLDILVNNAGIETSARCSTSTWSARRSGSSTGCARCAPAAWPARAAPS